MATHWSGVFSASEQSACSSADSAYHASLLQSKVVEPGRSNFQLTWFPGARLNYAENLLQRNDDGIACTAITEKLVAEDISYRQLRDMVAETAAAMKVNGLAVGDRVAGQ